MMAKYRSTPDQSTRLPGGIPYIIGNEFAERFSFYGMKGILTVFMTQHLLSRAGEPAFMNEEDAKATYHLFTAAAYFFPIIGAMISDILWGKYKTILIISLMYCFGHGMLALMDLGPELGLWDMKPFLFAGLILIAMGAGGIKPCVSAHVGDQFGSQNKHLLTQIFNWFYFAINVGAATSTLLTPLLLVTYGPWAAFGLPGVLMAIATFLFWLGRHKFIHVPAAGFKAWKEETFSKDGIRAVLNLSPLFLIFVPMFWAIFDQTGSAWVLQADKMDRELGFVWLPSQIQAINPLLILIGIPVFTYVIYPFMGKFFEPTPLRKIGIGLFLTCGAFCISAAIETSVESKQRTVAQNVFADLAADLETRQLGPAADADEEDPITKWSRAALTAADISKWSSEQIAAAIGINSDTLASLRDANQPITQVQAVSLFRSLADVDTTGPTVTLLNGAVAATRLLPKAASENEIEWSKETVNSYLKDMPNIIWQFLAYIILTSAEIMVSIVCLEFAYTQAPRKMKSFIMGIYFLGVSLGNLFTSGVNAGIGLLKSEDGTSALDGANYYWFFTVLMAITAVAFIFFALRYKGKTYIQGEDDELEAEAEAAAIGNV